MDYSAYEEMLADAEAEYDKEYSGGQYCHRQSFLWGYQEGFEAAMRKLNSEDPKETNKKKDFEVTWFGF